jgi:hypothetical protein
MPAHLDGERGFSDQFSFVGATMPHPMMRSPTSPKRNSLSLPCNRARPNAPTLPMGIWLCHIHALRFGFVIG